MNRENYTPRRNHSPLYTKNTQWRRNPKLSSPDSLVPGVDFSSLHPRVSLSTQYHSLSLERRKNEKKKE